MLYVFLVDTGTMLHMDMKLALEKVRKLKESIAKTYKIPVEKQAMLISGGENLDDDYRVCSYSAGTDTNPIFLFTMSSIDSNFPPTLTQDYKSETDMQDKVDGSLALPPSYQTVVSRAQLAQEFFEQAKKLFQDCELLVHEQHLQQQAWAAVIANLEDVMHSFQNRIEKFEEAFSSYIETREENIYQLKNFHEDLKLLDKIPILPALMEQIRQADASKVHYSLLEWINSKDSIYNLDEVSTQHSITDYVAVQCSRTLSRFDSHSYEGFQKEIKIIYDEVNSIQMREVKGLEDRLYRLDQLLHEGKISLREQGDQAQAFLQNQNRAGNLGDPSILPDLCTSHCKQLQVMLHNHLHLRDLRRRCAKAKEELASNLHTRLKWVTYVERTVCEMDSKLHLYLENLKRLKNHLGIMQQAHNAPSLYLETVAEVVRRRYFTENFQKSATFLAHRALEVYENEMQVRRAFMMKIHNHFLFSLFTGINDYPPPFAIQPPPPFDVNLPPLDKQDIEVLRQILPNMESHLQFSMTVPLSLTPVEPASESSSVSVAEPAPTTTEVLDTFVELQRPECAHAQGIPSEVLKHFSKKAAGLRTFSAFGKASSKGFGIMQVEEEDEDSEIKEPESEAETEEFEKVEQIVALCLNQEISSRNKSFNKVDDDEGISEAKQRKLEKSPNTENKPHRKLSAKLVHDRSVATEGLYSEDLPNIAASVSRSKPTKSFLSSLVPRSHSDGEIAHKAINLETLCGHHTVTSPAESCVLASQDFVTAEFFIDESMPSSYTESNGTSGTRGLTGGGGNNLTTGGSGHTVKSHHVIVAELQRHLEEKNFLITSLQDDLVKQRTHLEALEKKLQTLYSLECEKTHQLRQDLSELKLQALNQRDQMLSSFQSISCDFEKLSLGVSRRREEQQEQALQEMMSSLENDHKKVVADLNEQIKTASEKLQESHNQIDNYRQQLQETSEQLEKMKQKFNMDVEELKKDLEDERSEEVKKLALEHELELDSLKEELKALAECKEAELRHLNETKIELENEVQVLKRDLELVEEKLRDEFQQEKKQTLEALETAYKEREMDVVKRVRLETEAKLEDKTSKLKQEYEDKLTHAYNECQATVMQYGENIKLEAIQEQHWVWEEEKKKALDALLAQEEERRRQLEKKHYLEIAVFQQKALEEKEIAIRRERSKVVEDSLKTEQRIRSEAAECLEAKIHEHRTELEAVCNRLAAEKEQLFREREREICQRAEVEKAALHAELEASAKKWQEQKDQELEQMKEKMSQKHRSEVEGLRSRFRLCVSTTSLPPVLTAISSISAPVTPVGLSPMEESPPDDFTKIPLEGEFMPIFKHEAILVEAKQDAHAKAWAEATEQLAKKHREETAELMETMKREHEEQLSTMRASILGEKQACFNEAVNRVTREKDKIIEQLRNRERSLLAQMAEENAELEKMCSSNNTSILVKQDQETMDVGERMPRVKNWISSQLSDHEMVQSDSALNTSTIQEAAGGLSTSVAVVGGHERILELETTLRNKEEELKKLQNQLMGASISSSTSALVNQEKISVLSCNVGDIVLLCYDERHENYLAFLICPTYHFLHMDCLEVLGLKPAAGETRKSWVLAEVTDKEYCQTKKAQNRYRVPLGTKFYRIKAKPWDRVPSLTREEGTCGGVQHETSTRRASSGADASPSSLSSSTTSQKASSSAGDNVEVQDH